jgi:hypothetical protein
VDNRPPEIDLNEVVVKYRPVVSFKVRSPAPDLTGGVVTRSSPRLEKVGDDFRHCRSGPISIPSPTAASSTIRRSKVLKSVPGRFPARPCDDAGGESFLASHQPAQAGFRILNLCYCELARDEVAGHDLTPAGERAINYADSSEDLKT